MGEHLAFPIEHSFFLMGISKWLLGGIGFFLGGPIGGLAGLLLGSILGGISDNRSAEQESSRTYTRTGKRATPADIKVSLLVLIACVMKADGHVRKSELDVVKQFLLRTYGEQGALQALQLLKQLLEKDIDHRDVATKMAPFINYSTRHELVHFLLQLANADGDFAVSEQVMIREIAAALGITAADTRSLFAIYEQPTNPNWAYEALEVSPDASDDEIKKAYRRVAMKYHPDKVASAGEEVRQQATKKFQAIQEAYEQIKKQRGIA